MKKRTLIEVTTLLVAIAAGALFIGRLDQRVAVLEGHDHSGADDQRTLIEFQARTSPDATWSDAQFCPAGQYVCGLRQMVEPYTGPGEDDSGVNSVGFYCCPLALPSEDTR